MAKAKKIYIKKPREKKKEHITEAAQHKGDFRKTPRWKAWRRYLIEKQKTDPITGSKLTRSANCHHMDMREENYENLDESRFIIMNCKSHSLLHFVFATRDWRAAIKALYSLCEKMEKYNKDNPNWSFDDANNRAWPIE